MNYFFYQDESECLFSHDVDVPQVWELCKFYVYERCVKKDKCLYLHKGFPCKFYHLGLDCPATRESCKFSHEPLNDITRGLLLKVSLSSISCIYIILLFLLLILA